MLSKSDPGHRFLAKALRVLAARSRSEGELRARLLAEEGADPDSVDQCISHLTELGFINDRRMAESFANYRLNNKLVGRARLAREMERRKIPRDTIEEVLDAVIDDDKKESLIDQAADKWLRTHGQPLDAKNRRKMFQHLARLGHDFDLIQRKIGRLKTIEVEPTDW